MRSHGGDVTVRFLISVPRQAVRDTLVLGEVLVEDGRVEGRSGGLEEQGAVLDHGGRQPCESDYFSFKMRQVL